MMKNLDFSKIPTPCYVVDEDLLVKNLEILKHVQEKSGGKILLAQKGFSMYSLYPLIGKYLAGTTASSLFEAKLGFEEMGKENHIFSPAYIPEEIDEIIQICGHMVFNSFYQWEQFKGKILCSDKKVSCGLRINPEYSEIEKDIYNPCVKGSRLGIKLLDFEGKDLSGIEGLHFHTLCEQGYEPLIHTLEVVEKKFDKYLKTMKWLNFGGGHHITKKGYNVSGLIDIIKHFKQKYGFQVYLEPGEAIALGTGFLVAKVIDIIDNGMEILILDTSAACHMPDVLEMPYRPEIIGGKLAYQGNYTYRLAGPTCLAGDIIGDYSFSKKIKRGDKVVFCDMAHYTMVKNNTFNGINLPAIAATSKAEGVKIIKQFSYLDFKSRL